MFRFSVDEHFHITYILAFNPLSPHDALNHRHPLQVENCDSNSRLLVDEDDNVKSGLKGLNATVEQPLLKNMSRNV